MRFSATGLDLSRIDRGSLWPDHSFEQIRTDRIADLQARLDNAGIPYDVSMLETDPSVILQEASGYRELLTRQAIDDAEAKVLLAFSFGPFLDRLGDLHGCARMAGEADERYRTRIQLAPEAFPATGTAGGYIYHAVSTDLDVRDVGLSILNRGTPDVQVELSILARSGDGTPSAALLQAIRSRLYAHDIKLLTDVVIVRPCVIINYDLTATLTVRLGPDPATIKTTAIAAVRAAAERYKRVGGDLPASALSAALYVSNVDRVDLTLSDVITQRWQAPSLRNISLKMVAQDDE